MSAPIVWDLDRALAYIRQLQPAAMNAGWCLMLAGGVLNNGASGKDLDLMAYPRTRQARRCLLQHVICAQGFVTHVHWTQVDVADIWTYLVNGRQVDLVFQTWPADR